MKSTIGRVSLILAVIAAAGLLLGAALFSRSVDRRFESPAGHIDEERVAGSGFTRLEVDAVESTIVWQESADDRIRLTLQGRTNDNSPALHLTESGATLRVEVRRPGKLLSWAKTVLTIHAPRKKWAGLALRTVSGEIELASVETDELEARSVSGDLHLSGIRAARTKIETVSGDCILDGRPGDLTAKSVSGDLSIRIPEVDGDLNLRSTSGEIELNFPDGADFLLDAKTVSGQIECGFPLTITERDKRGRRLRGASGGGGERVSIDTVSGDIEVY